ncbi:hypothetical protein SKAU_G00224900 [Synaphobranchus kaupii]|uniref:Uncharacterized protein n=1 Tax=Synaphobranchus kaupii TaxID=118154 RepID=A0A9Q1FBG9_SYNKA|nr:hypothetical protein SKAU_G00224900 [Synaphobranchus kaupii]
MKASTGQPFLTILDVSDSVECVRMCVPFLADGQDLPQESTAGRRRLGRHVSSLSGVTEGVMEDRGGRGREGGGGQMRRWALEGVISLGQPRPLYPECSPGTGSAGAAWRQLRPRSGEINALSGLTVIRSGVERSRNSS